MGRTKSIVEMVPFALSAIKLERGAFAASQNQRFLKSFLDDFGKRELASITPRDLLAFRASLAEKYKPSTTNLYLMAAKRLLRWAAENEFRKPLFLDGIKPVKDNDEKPNKAWEPTEVQRLLGMAKQFNGQAYRWAAVQYLSLMRPSEILALVLWKNGHEKADKSFRQESEGVFSFRGKTTFKSGIRRTLILCPEALGLLKECEPRWTCWRTYWQACDTAMDHGPHQFRHSGIAHLSAKLGAEGYGTVRLIAGHYSDVAITMKHYASPNWESLRKYGSLLTENLPR